MTQLRFDCLARPSKTLLITILVVLLSCFAFAPARSQVSGDPFVDHLAPVTRAFALCNATIVQSPGRVMDHATVVVRNGLIVAVGQNVHIPPDAEVIDGESLVVYAGFIDCLSTAGVVIPAPTRDAPTPQDPGEPPRSMAGIQPERDVRAFFSTTGPGIDSLRSAGFTIAHVVPSGGMLPGAGAVVSLGGDSAHTVIVSERSLVAAFAPAHRVYPSTSMAIMATWRNLYRKAAEVIAEAEAYRASPLGRRRSPVDPTIEAFVPVLGGTKRVFFITSDVLELYRAVRLRNELNFSMVVAGLRDPRGALDALKRERLSVILSLDLPRGQDGESDSGRSFADSAVDREADTHNAIDERRVHDFKDIERERRHLENDRISARRELYTFPARLAAESIPFSFGTMGARPGSIRSTLSALVRLGLSPDKALAALTTEPAALLGLGASAGTVEVGRMADLVVTDGDYVTDSTRIVMVIVDGVRYPIRTDDDSSNLKNRPEWRVRSDVGEASVEGLPSQAEVETVNKILRARSTDVPGTILVRNGTVLTVTDGTLTETDVLVQDGIIVRIGKDLHPPADAVVVDATGQWVMPGIIDAHSHLGIDDVNEWTNPVTAEVSVADVVDPFDLNMYRALAGGVTISHAMHGSANPIGGQCQTLKHRYGITDPSGLIMQGAPRTIKFALGENPTRVHGRGHGIAPSTRMGVEQVIRSAFARARAYADGRRNWQEGRGGQPLMDPYFDLRLETLAAILRGEIIVHCHAYRADEILMLMRVFRDFGVKRLIFQHANEGFKVAPEIADFGAMASVFADWWAYKIEVYYSTAYNATVLTRNGVVTSINSDSPELIRHLNHEAAKTMRYGGLTPDEALALITINPARQLGIDDRVGSLEIGKEGDIAIFSGMPLSIYSTCTMTIVDGIVRFDAANDPDDMQMRVDPGAPVAVWSSWDTDYDACMEGAEVVSREEAR